MKSWLRHASVLAMTLACTAAHAQAPAPAPAKATASKADPAAASTEAQVAARFAERSGGSKPDQVFRGPGGLFEVLIGGELYYVDAQVNFVIAGRMFDARTREDLTQNGLEVSLYLQFRNVFMFWLPRLCEHCLNPACVASCPSGALYKRHEDGIVLVDQERCRGWRYCVSGCPYKKVYFNWKTGRAEKCIFCYPRTEAGLTTLCAHSCVGRIRYVGVFLYDADRIAAAAATPSATDVYPAHLDILLDPEDSEVRKAAVAEGISPNVLADAERSPVYKLIKRWRVALPSFSRMPAYSDFLNGWMSVL